MDPLAYPVGTLVPVFPAARRREDWLTGSLAIVGGTLILVGASTTLLYLSAIVAGYSQRSLSEVLSNPLTICFWTGHGLLAGLAISIGIRTLRGRPGEGTALFLIGLVEMPAWVIFLGGPIALAGGVVLLAAGIHARVTSYSVGARPRRS
jgi:hypothetical protein